MKEPHIMLDIESTDTDFKIDDILSISALEVTFEDGFWRPGKVFNKYLHTDKEPTTNFAKENLSELFERCRKLPYQTTAEVRKELRGFFEWCGRRPPYVYLMGWNVANFDIPFLLEKGYLEPFYRQTINGMEIATGDFHYRTYEQSGSISTAQDVLQIDDRNLLVEMAIAAYPELVLPAGKQHESLFDCYKQLRIQNGIIRLLRQAKRETHKVGDK